MPAYDAIIVGGGPAGSTCARALVAAGRAVLVIDRSCFPRDKICAGWITPPVVDALRIDLADYGAGRTCQPITSFSTGLVGGSTITTRYDRTISYGILRREFDWYLLERSGARLELGLTVTGLRREGLEWVINERYRAPLLIGAGGHFCPVARHLSLRRPDAPTVAAQEIEFPLAPADEPLYPIAPQTPELYFWPDLRGYGWCFRKGRHLNVGMGRIGGGRFTEHVKRFVQFLRESGRAPASLPTRWPGHAYLLYEGTGRPLLADGVMLVGDAAGLAYPQSGEGIRTAVESGLLAARAALGAGDRRTAADLEPYRQALHARLGEPRHGPALTAWLPPSFLDAIGPRLLTTRWFSRRVLLDRWFLHASQPPLAAAPAPR